VNKSLFASVRAVDMFHECYGPVRERAWKKVRKTVFQLEREAEQGSSRARKDQEAPGARGAAAAKGHRA